MHFLAGDAPDDIAWKALAVNVSDLAAKGAKPIGYLMALSFPEAPTQGWMAGFAAGLRAAQDRFGCHLIGGDTDRRPGPLTIAITVVGSVAQGRMVRRGTARPGDVLFVSGTLGDAALGLALRKGPDLAKAWGLSPEEDAHLRRRYLRPEPRLALAPALRAHASAAMDISDGLAKDLGRMCAASGCGAHVRFADLPALCRRRESGRRRPGLRESHRCRRRRLRGSRRGSGRPDNGVRRGSGCRGSGGCGNRLHDARPQCCHRGRRWPPDCN